MQNKSPVEAIKNGFALVTEERRSTGIFGGLDISFNSLISNMKSYQKGGLLSNKSMKSDTQWVIDSIKQMGLRTAREVLNAPREMLVEKADLEEETVDHIINVLRAEFEQ